MKSPSAAASSALLSLPSQVLVSCSTLKAASSSTTAVPLLVSDVGLSFWGGIDPVTSQIVDTQHPLHGQYVHDKILCIPSGRGSCTASQVLLQLILNHKAPKAIVLRQNDPLVAVGALVAQHVFQTDDDDSLTIPTIVNIGVDGFAQLLECTDKTFGQMDSHGGTTALLVSSDSDLLASYSMNDRIEMIPEQSLSEEQTESKSNYFKQHNAWTDYEQERWNQAETEAERLALQVMYHYARIAIMDDSSSALHSEEPSYVSVSRAHIDACTYIGSGSLALVQRFVEKGGHVRIPTTLNAVSTDRRQWQQLGVPSQYAQNANALGDAYLQLDCQPTFTCAPYLLLSPSSENTSTFEAQDWIWGESNAVVYANSVLGARTNKTADYLDMCGALTGIVPRTGMHCPEQRVPTGILDATALTEQSYIDRWESSLFFALLGHACGTLSDGAVPLLVGLEQVADRITRDDLKTFCAAFGTTGSSPLVHIAGVTAEAKDHERVVEPWKQSIVERGGNPIVKVTAQFMEKTYISLNSCDTSEQKIDLIALGNPHLSVSECQTLVDLITKTDENEERSSHVRIMACISRSVQAQAAEQGLIEPLENFGIEFINDTCWCMLLDPPVIPAAPEATILTNSGKYAHYGPGLTQRKLKIGSTADCISAARTGVFRPSLRAFHTNAQQQFRRPQRVLLLAFHFVSRALR
ncbi:hypothetical protein FisN_23Lh042 [Fistulifera solaris]|uniref:Aconitase X catalytic domain-containing protein n=1 Tax=Fistulifera solaris TaxID=1519565 RepID=A0A1Z5KJM7_FISSO|nr:hypothetical protein FisN_23Lh042 [Fistulifera solaris]|eukprot:GAX26514.1 hypothetical protein FisN_23Lh042 [Fistulifera solaris]